jgi:hypothetical protein
MIIPVRSFTSGAEMLSFYAANRRSLWAKPKLVAIPAPEPEPEPQPEPFPPQRLTMALVVKAVAESSGYSVRDLKGPSQLRGLAAARQCAIFLMKELIPGVSQPQMAAPLGDRDHTTILHSIRVWPKKRENPVYLEWEVSARRMIAEWVKGNSDEPH